MTKDFNDFYWHDAELRNLSIDRRDPGNLDEIRIRVAWPDDELTQTIVFYDCYAAKLDMNFGIVAYESILQAKILEDDPYLDILFNKWKSISLSSNSITCFFIETASTASSISIYAKGFRVE